MTECKLHGSGGHITAEITDEELKKADLGVGRLFLAPINKLEPDRMQNYFCKACQNEFNGPTKIQIEESPNEEIAENLILVERGQYTCGKCQGIIGEYRVFNKQDENAGTEKSN